MFGSNTNLGSFQTVPALETILTRAKTLIPTLQNENLNWYAISNPTQTSVTLTAKDNNFYYEDSVNLTYEFSPQQSLFDYVNNDALEFDYDSNKYLIVDDIQSKSEDEIKEECFNNIFPSLSSRNQINTSIVWDQEYGAAPGTPQVSTISGLISFTPVNGSTAFSSDIYTIGFNNGIITPKATANTNGPAPFVFTSSGQYSTYQPYGMFSSSMQSVTWWGADSYVRVDLASTYVLTGFRISSGVPNDMPMNAFISGSLDGEEFFSLEDWETIQLINPNAPHFFRFTNPVTTRFFHFRCTRSIGSFANYWVTTNCEIYGYPVNE